MYTFELNHFTTASTCWESRHGEGTVFDCPPSNSPPHRSNAVDSSFFVEALMAYYRTNKLSRFEV